MENIEFTANDGDKIIFEKTDIVSLPLKINIGAIHGYFLEPHETIALRNLLNSLDLEKKKDCKDGQHSGDTGKCSECGRTYIHGK